MDYLPIFVDVRGQPCLVVGGGPIAARKVELLQAAGAVVHVVAPRVCEALLSKAEGGVLRISQRPVDTADLAGAHLVVAATDDEEVNARVAGEARARSIPVNVVDAPALCSFIMPALIERGAVLVAVSTGGASPVLARLVRARIEGALPPGLGALAGFAARHRETVKRALTPAARRRFWEHALQGAVAELVMAGRIEEADRALDDLLVRGAVGATGAVALIAVGTCDPERQTLGAARWLSGADLVLHDAGAAQVVRALCRRDAELRLLGPLPEQLESVLARARAGQRVCLVRSGDAYAERDPADAQLLARDGLHAVIYRAAP